MAYVSIWTVFSILTEYLNMSNVHAPRMLKDSEKERHVKDSKSFLKHYEKECALSMKQSGFQLNTIVFIKTTHHFIQQHPHC